MSVGQVNNINSSSSFFTRAISHTVGVISDLATLPFGLFALQIACQRSNFDPVASEVKKDKPPILLIHGNGFNEIQWALARYFLSGSDYGSVFTLNLDGLVTNQEHMGIDDYAKLVEKKIEEIKKLTGRDDIILAGHSMGGLVAAYYDVYLAEKNKTNVKGVIPISTPWVTSPLLDAVTRISKSYLPGAFRSPKRYKQMRNEEGFLTRLIEKILLNPSNYYCMYSEGDEMVPGECGLLPGLPKERVRKFSWLGHYSPMLSYTVWTTLQKWITQISQQP